MKYDSKLVLVVDDYPQLANVIQTAITRKLGSRVITAYSGQQALEMLENASLLKFPQPATYSSTYSSNQPYYRETSKGVLPDLIITDLEMQGMDGVDFCYQLKTLRGCQTIPIIICSADSRTLPSNLEIAAFVEKPFKLDALLKIIKQQLD